jgi:hypothetical protein
MKGSIAGNGKIALHFWRSADMDEKAIKTQKVAELAISLFMIVFSIVMLHVAFTAPVPSRLGSSDIAPMTAPKFILAILLILSVVQLFKSIKWFMANKLPGIKVRFLEGKSAVILITLFVYVFLWNTIGFIISSFIMFVFTVKYLEPKRDLKKVILFGVLFVAGVAFLFGYVFRITLGEPLFDMLLRYFM